MHGVTIDKIGLTMEDEWPLSDRDLLILRGVHFHTATMSFPPMTAERYECGKQTSKAQSTRGNSKQKNHCDRLVDSLLYSCAEIARESNEMKICTKVGIRRPAD